MTDLSRYTDVHTHDTSRALDGDAIVSVEAGTTLLPGGTYSVGIHPWNTDRPVTLGRLRALVAAARDPRVVAIGECGFDRLRGGSPEVQRRLFDFHARLAEQTGKPLIIHNVRSTDELIAARRRHRPTVEWVIHGFRGHPQLAAQLLRAGFSLSTRQPLPGIPSYPETD